MKQPCASLGALAAALSLSLLRPAAPLPRAFVDGQGWQELSLADFINVNGDQDTWREEGGVIHCSGTPVGGARSKEAFENFELVLEWKHLSEAGNSGVFLWCPEEAFTDLKPGQLPRSGIEVQVLDLAYETRWQESHDGKHSDWFTSHGDVFPVGASKMTAHAPTMTYQEGDLAFTVGNPNSARSFPSARLTKPAGQWNHYYIRAINGEVRLWVNGEEVTAGGNCTPSKGYLALEAEGAPIEFRNLRLRRLP